MNLIFNRLEKKMKEGTKEGRESVGINDVILYSIVLIYPRSV